MNYETDLQFFIAYLVSIHASFSHNKGIDDGMEFINIIWEKREHFFTTEGAFYGIGHKLL